SAFDMVEPMEFLYIRIVKAKDLIEVNDDCTCDPYVEVRVGNYKAITKTGEKLPNPEWNQVFAFSKERVHTFFIEIFLKTKVHEGDGVKGRLILDVNEAPKRVPPDSPLAPQWYKLEDLGGVCVKPELMLAVWMGTQADEAFTEAWHLDAVGVSCDEIVNTKSKVYMSPKLWYLRVNVIQAQNLEMVSKNKRPEVFVKAVFGETTAKTKISTSRNVLSPLWNEDLMFVAAEPFDSLLTLTVENKVGNNEEVIGKCVIHLGKLERRLGNKPVDSRWFTLERPVVEDGKKNGKETPALFNSKLQLRASLDGGYHVLDETSHNSSDMRPTVRQLWKQEIGVLELGILNATGLPQMKIMKNGQGGRTDAYCVAKYGQKWVRTRTIIDSSSPQWNEQYTWEVFDPCTVITVGVFDNCHFQGPDNVKGAKDSRIGKVRIRLSTLETDRIYTYSFPLLVLETQGLKKMGDLQLAIRFSCSSFFNLLQVYTQPILPKMHYSHPLSLYQQECLRHQATQLLSLRLGRSEPPLRMEIVKDMLDYDSRNWSKRRTTANSQRIKAALSGVGFLFQFLETLCSWKRPVITVLVHLFLFFLIFYPQFIISSICFNLSVIGLWNYRARPRNPPHMDPQLSNVHKLIQEDLEEEFDGIPTTCKNNDTLKFRYNRLRVIAGKMQILLGDLATQLERLQSLLSWRDPRATAMFVCFCVVSGIVLSVIPLRITYMGFVVYFLRHPKFRSKLPSVPVNFLRRLPAKTDSLL
ncbi:FT-interacting protein 3, partial [Spinacia oleracea]|uniref:FT-interacting protein 3 n=1 Tax=Spinacia oleracea TaxID=3562 RepID=A0A9R0ILJ4_SPIOL